jgi:uncharacterized protein
MSTKTGFGTATKTYAVTGLFIYPVKGCAGYAVSSAALTARGFENDRLYLIVSPDGTFLTQREFPGLCLIRPALTDAGIAFKAPSHPKIDVPIPKDEALRPVRIWRDDCLAYDQGKEIAEWLSSYIGKPYGLVRMSDDHPRPVDRDYGRADDIVSFADGFPFLITNEASLEELNSRLETPVPMDRFRPNIVLAGDHSWEEDYWKLIHTQDAEIEIVKNCSRCVVTTVDQKTGERGKEPLKTLATYRTVDSNRVIFGQNGVPRKLGTLRVGEMASVILANMDNQ